MGRKLFLLVVFVARLLTTVFVWSGWIVNRVSNWVLRLVDQKSWVHSVAAQEQAQELAELSALTDAMRAKKRATYFDEEDWPTHEIVNLSEAVSELEDLGWEPEDCQDFVRRLTDGRIQFGSLEDFGLDDDDDDDHELSLD
jgi:hypothetical protein